MIDTSKPRVYKMEVLQDRLYGEFIGFVIGLALLGYATHYTVSSFLKIGFASDTVLEFLVALGISWVLSSFLSIAVSGTINIDEEKIAYQYIGLVPIAREKRILMGSQIIGVKISSTGLGFLNHNSSQLLGELESRGVNVLMPDASIIRSGIFIHFKNQAFSEFVHLPRKVIPDYYEDIIQFLINSQDMAEANGKVSKHVYRNLIEGETDNDFD
ncbi:MAG: hypothetical protein ACM3UZ_07230 [Acidobacteriota bacterium]